MDKDYFTLMQFSAKWDPIPSMLCQNHTQLVKGFMGQTTSFDSALIKSNVLIMGSCELNGKHDIFKGQRNVYTYGGHDRKTFTSGGSANGLGFTLIPRLPINLNNVLFPAARRKNRRLNLHS
jgi:hypothetical protein